MHIGDSEPLRPTREARYQLTATARSGPHPGHSKMRRDVAGRRRIRTWMERVALGAIMGAVAFVVERRLLKALRRRGQAEPGVPSTGRGAELSASPEDIPE